MTVLLFPLTLLFIVIGMITSARRLDHFIDCEVQKYLTTGKDTSALQVMGFVFWVFVTSVFWPLYGVARALHAVPQLVLPAPAEPM